MSLHDLDLDTLKALASEHNLEGRSKMNQTELAEALEGIGVFPPGAVSGFQQGVAYPEQPQTREDFQRLLVNPDLPPERQSAPPQELLNPQLFPTRLE